MFDPNGVSVLLRNLYKEINLIEVVIGVNNILASWDPVGSQLVDQRWLFEEYKQYVSGVIAAYLKGEVMFDYLIGLDLNLGSNNENMASTRIASEQLVGLLSNVSGVKLKSFLNNL